MRRLWRPALDRLTPYEAGPSLEALRAQLGLAEVTRLSANENPLGPSPRAVEAVRAEAARAHLYPDGGGTALRLALATSLGVTADAVILGNGADELLGLIAWAALEAGGEAGIPHPAFEPYWTLVTLAGAPLPGRGRAPPAFAAPRGGGGRNPGGGKPPVGCPPPPLPQSSRGSPGSASA